MEPSILFVLGLIATLKEVGSTRVLQRHDVNHQNVHEYRRLKKANSHLQKIERNPWEFEEMEAEGKEIHMVELQIREEYTSDVDDAELAKGNEIQPVRLDCHPDACKESLDECQNCQVTYCMTDIDLASEKPNEYPNFLDVIDTEHCNAQSVQWDLNTISEELTTSDETNSEIQSLPLTLGIFEMGPGSETRRITTFLAADPENLVFTDAQPIYEALMMCSDKRKALLRKEPCSRENVIKLLRKTADLMCRTDDPMYKECNVKLWADSTLEIGIFEEAFPEAEMMFIYTDPNAHMGSVIDPAHVERSFCAKHKRNPSKTMEDAALRMGKNIQELSIEEICAVDVYNIMEAVLMQKGKTNKVKVVHADDALDAIEGLTKAKLNKGIVKGEVGGKIGKLVGGLTKEVNEEVSKRVEKMKGIALKDRNGNFDPNRYENKKQEILNRVTGKMAAASAEFLDQPFNALENANDMNKS